ncbi:MAG: hypothetical protein R6U91_05275 [Bacillota bacterium]
MAKRNIYVHDEMQELWDKAIELVGEVSLSEILTSHIEQLIEAQEMVTDKFEKVELLVGEWNAERIVTFQGRAVGWSADGYQVTYLTPKGKLVIYRGDDLEGPYDADYFIFNTVGEAAKEIDSYGELAFDKEMLKHVGEELGDPFIEILDG